HDGPPRSVIKSGHVGFFSPDTSVIASAGCGGESEEGVSAGAPAASGPLQVGERDDGVIAVGLRAGVLAAVPVAALGAESAHGGGVAAGVCGGGGAGAGPGRPPPPGPGVFVRGAG